jgi:transcriptional regulator with XRE-family HTH domain
MNSTLERIAKCRRILGWTQQQLSERTGIHQTRISRFELGKSIPRPEELMALSKVLGVSMESLVDPTKECVMSLKIE